MSEEGACHATFFVLSGPVRLLHSGRRFEDLAIANIKLEASATHALGEALTESCFQTRREVIPPVANATTSNVVRCHLPTAPLLRRGFRVKVSAMRVRVGERGGAFW